MGVDIYLRSIWEPWFEAWKDSEAARRVYAIANAKAALEATYDAYRSSGGYFRNGYNSGDVMWAMGLSWRETVGLMLDAEHQLPVEKACELAAMIEERPLTRERVARHYFENITDGVESHPLTGATSMLMYEGAAKGTGVPPQPLQPPDFDYLLTFLTKRREELLAILRKSIERGEPLECSL